MGILEWLAISFSGDLPSPEIKPRSPALTGRFFATETPGKHIYEYYLACKRKTILTQATTWINLEDIMLSEVSYRRINTV